MVSLQSASDNVSRDQAVDHQVYYHCELGEFHQQNEDSIYNLNDECRVNSDQPKHQYLEEMAGINLVDSNGGIKQRLRSNKSAKIDISDGPDSNVTSSEARQQMKQRLQHIYSVNHPVGRMNVGRSVGQQINQASNQALPTLRDGIDSLSQPSQKQQQYQLRATDASCSSKSSSSHDSSNISRNNTKNQQQFVRCCDKVLRPPRKGSVEENYSCTFSDSFCHIHDHGNDICNDRRRRNHNGRRTSLDSLEERRPAMYRSKSYYEGLDCHCQSHDIHDSIYEVNNLKQQISKQSQTANVPLEELHYLSSTATALLNATANAAAAIAAVDRQLLEHKTYGQVQAICASQHQVNANRLANQQILPQMNAHPQLSRMNVYNSIVNQDHLHSAPLDNSYLAQQRIAFGRQQPRFAAPNPISSSVPFPNIHPNQQTPLQKFPNHAVNIPSNQAPRLRNQVYDYQMSRNLPQPQQQNPHLQVRPFVPLQQNRFNVNPKPIFRDEHNYLAWNMNNQLIRQQLNQPHAQNCRPQGMPALLQNKTFNVTESKDQKYMESKFQQTKRNGSEQIRPNTLLSNPSVNHLTPFTTKPAYIIDSSMNNLLVPRRSSSLIDRMCKVDLAVIWLLLIFITSVCMAGSWIFIHYIR